MVVVPVVVVVVTDPPSPGLVIKVGVLRLLSPELAASRLVAESSRPAKNQLLY